MSIADSAIPSSKVRRRAPRSSNALAHPDRRPPFTPWGLQLFDLIKEGLEGVSCALWSLATVPHGIRGHEALTGYPLSRPSRLLPTCLPASLPWPCCTPAHR